MNDIRYDLSYLTDPQVFAVGRLPAVSDHDTFASVAEAQQGNSSLRKNLDGVWKFAYAENTVARPIGFEQPDFSCSGWSDIHVPGHIQMQGWSVPQYVNTQYPWDGHEPLLPPQIPQRHNPVGSYVTHFRRPDGWENDRLHLVLHGVESACFVWVNGILIGYAEDSFTPSRFDITDAICDGENKLAIEVFRFCSGSWLEDQDFWRFSGIFRSVELQAVPRAHVEDMFVHAKPEENLQSAQLSAEVKLALPTEPVTLAVELLDAAGMVVDQFAQRAEALFRFERTIPNPLLWNAEQPKLYTLRLTLIDGRQGVVEVSQTEVGFRRFEIRDGVMLLNGKRILLHGVNRHEFGHRSGRAIGETDMLWDIQTLKRHNINAVRTSHYPNHSLWYRLCDRYGIYLIDEANLETHGTWMKMGQVEPAQALPNDREEWLAACLDRAQSMLERDKNHPSVLLWSCGNESYGGRDIFEMAEFYRRRDPDRPVHYEGVYYDRRYNATSDVESRMYPPASEVAAWLDMHTNKPYVLCEYSHAMGNSCGGLQDYLTLEDRYPQYQGGFIWDWIDQAIETILPGGERGLAYGGDFADQPTDRNFCGDGLVFADRTYTPKLQEVKYLYQNVRVLPDMKGVVLENRNLFDDLGGYRLAWSLALDGKEIANGTLGDVVVSPGKRRIFALPLPEMAAPGEYALLCELRLKTATLWAEEGFALMHGQTVIANIPPVETDEEITGYAIARGDVNVGAYADGCEALFSLSEGGLVSLRRCGEPTAINHAPRLSLYRSPIDNDIGNEFAQDTALWFAFSELAYGECTAVHTQAGRLRISYRYKLTSLTDAYVDTAYEVIAAHRVRVEVSFPGGENLPDLPSFGLSFRLPRALRHVRYYGLGPVENGIDRRAGGVLGIFETSVEQNLTPYLKPQACGNRAGVRWLELTDGHERGLRVRMEGKPLEISVLPHSQAELAAALHQQDLPRPAYTYLDVAMARYGVGGDNSWGAPVLPHYRLHANQPLRFSFILELL